MNIIAQKYAKTTINLLNFGHEIGLLWAFLEVRKIINEVTFCICVLILIFTCVGLSLITLKERKTSESNIISKLIEERDKHNADENYVKPKFKELTQEQIEDIHARGKITPREKVKEWEGMDLCAPGDAIGSAAWRCRKFKNCHDCLVDYANQHEEYTSFFDDLKECKPFKL